MFQKLFGFLHKKDGNEKEKDHNHDDDDDVDDINNLGPMNENKLTQLKKYICKKDFESFLDFAKYYTNNSPHSQCVTSWNQNSIACRCKQCQLCSNSCVCVKCFLEGPHRYHSCMIHITSSGNCDCGDPSGWKLEGFCKRHRCYHLKPQPNIENQNNDEIVIDDTLSPDDDRNYFVPNGRARENDGPDEEKEYVSLSPQLKERLLKAFSVVKIDLEEMITRQNFRYFSECCQFFMDFTSLGDEIRSCVCVSLNDVDFLSKIFLQAQILSNSKIQEFFHLSGALCSDPSFSIPYSEAASQTIPRLLDVLYQNANLPFINRNSIPISGIDTTLHFDFQYLAVYPLKILLSQKKFNWIEFCLKYSDILGDFILHEENIYSLTNFESVLTSFYSYLYILRVVLHLESEKPKMKEFMIKFCKSLERFEGFVPSYLNNNSQIYDVFEFILNLSKLPYKLMKGLPYFTPEVTDIFIYHLLNRKPKDENKMRNYSQSVMLHQIFLINLLTFNRKSDFQIASFIDNNKKDDDNDDNDKNDIRRIEFNNCYDGKDPQDTFEYYCRQNLLRRSEINLNTENMSESIFDIYIKSIDTPMTLIAAHYLIHFHQNPIRMPSNCMQCVNRIHIHNGFLAYILPNMMALVQVMFSFTSKDKKDNMIKEFALYFGAIDLQYNESNRKMRDFAFVMFLSSLILDRDGINNNYKNICLKNLMTEMKHRTVGTEEILGIISPCAMSTNGFKEKYETMNIENDWHIVIPYYTRMNVLYDDVLPTIIEKTQEMLLPFPEFSDPSVGDKENKINSCPNLLIKRLPEVFECRYLFAIIYYFIFEYNTDLVFVQYALNLFITIAENTKDEEDEQPENLQPIIARTPDDLAKNIKTNNFRTFVKTPVIYKGNRNCTLAQLVNDLGVIGLSALRRIGMSIQNIKKSKKKVLRLKRSISKSLRQSSQRFETTIDRRSHDCCAICHKVLCRSENQQNQIENKFDSEMLYIPVSIFKSVSNEFVDNFIHDRITSKTTVRYDSKCLIRRNMNIKYVHKKCFAGMINSHEYYLMPKIDHLPFNIIDDLNNDGNKDNDNKNNDKIILPNLDDAPKNTLEITTKRNNHDGLNFRINLNLNNLTINGVPLNLNNNNHNDININLDAIPEENNENGDIGPLKFLQNVINRNSSNTLINGHNTNSNNNIQSIMLKTIFNFLSESNFYRTALEVLSQMIMTLDHRSRLIPEVLDDPLTSSLYSNLFRNSIYLFYLKGKDVKLTMQIRDNICDVILECLKMKAPKAQTKSYQLMFEKEKQDYAAFIAKNKEELGEISFDQYFFSKIVQSKGSLEIQLDTNDYSQKTENIMNERSYEFLRRCYLIEKFYLCDNSDVNDLFIDWDFYLNASNLYEHFYHKKLPENFESPVLPVYRGLNLPNHFLELIYPPFNVSFDKIDRECSMCLFSGAKTQDRAFDFRRLPRFGMPFTVTLNLSGMSITSISFVTQDGITSRKLQSIYVDKNGCPDPGFRRGDNLFLSREKYNKLIDDFLSGNLLNFRY